jgi:hypothetical protein
MALGFTQSLTEMSTRKCVCGVESGWRVRLTTSLPSVSPLSRQVGSSTTHDPIGLHGLLQGYNRQTLWPESASDSHSLAKLVPAFVDKGYHVVSVTDPHGRILGFLDRSPYFFFHSSSIIVLTRLSGPRSRPTTSQKIW